MEKQKPKIPVRAVIIGMTALSMFIIGCSADSPMKPQDEQSYSADYPSLNKNSKQFNSNNSAMTTAASLALTSIPDPGAFPQFATRDFQYKHDDKTYVGGQMTVPGGTKFKLATGALTPPPGTAVGETVTITMLVEKDTVNNELIFTFSPHGSQFNPPAEVWLDYSQLDIPVAKLYYIRDDGQYILMHADQDDRKNKKMMLLIPHFSRYAIAHSR